MLAWIVYSFAKVGLKLKRSNSGKSRKSLDPRRHHNNFTLDSFGKRAKKIIKCWKNSVSESICRGNFIISHYFKSGLFFRLKFPVLHRLLQHMDGFFSVACAFFNHVQGMIQRPVQ